MRQKGRCDVIQKAIRNYNSKLPYPPRLCNLILSEDNVAALEFKLGDRKEVIPLPDFLAQLGECIK